MTSGRSPAVSVRNLTKAYDGVRVLDGVSFDVERGSVVGLLGPNGAGKTTCIHSILGLVRPTAGSVRVAGIDVAENPRAAYEHVGATLEGARNVYWRLTVRENVEFFARLAGHDPAELRERHDRLLEGFGLADRADELVNDLSRGMKGKVALACTLSRDVDVAFLDEPTLGLDVESSHELRRELRRLAERESITVVVSSHDMDVIEDLCDRVVVLNDGRIVADEDVEAFVSLFEGRTYRIAVEGRISESAKARLVESFDASEWSSVPDGTRFDVTLADGELNAVLVELVAAGIPVRSIETTDPTLEDAFVALVEDGETAGGTTEVSA
ncbi:ATP-binding cassette domain-containing protein [Haladaptatus sp. CMAA 1909]|uniref:ABC transporter ATP-binding protein n=1 Tax=Haladaptatus sp. CMAA 1909 TaxID=3368986 RepID=UPI00375405BE